jgi:hypothetical protein
MARTYITRILVALAITYLVAIISLVIAGLVMEIREGNRGIFRKSSNEQEEKNPVSMTCALVAIPCVLAYGVYWAGYKVVACALTWITSMSVIFGAIVIYADMKTNNWVPAWLESFVSGIIAGKEMVMDSFSGLPPPTVSEVAKCLVICALAGIFIVICAMPHPLSDLVAVAVLIVAYAIMLGGGPRNIIAGIRKLSG